ncbi:hypothetical protein NQ314_018328, partial [Rhamnusium bicolor]
ERNKHLTRWLLLKKGEELKYKGKKRPVSPDLDRNIGECTSSKAIIMTCQEPLDINIPDQTALSPEKTPQLLFPSSSTQTPNLLSAHTPRREKFRQTIKYLQNENYRLKKRVEELEGKFENSLADVSLEQYNSLTYKFCSSQKLARFVNVQVALSQKKSKGRR